MTLTKLRWYGPDEHDDPTSPPLFVQTTRILRDTGELLVNEFRSIGSVMVVLEAIGERSAIDAALPKLQKLSDNLVTIEEVRAVH